MKKILFLFLLVTLMSSVAKAQILKIGFRAEPAVFITEQKNNFSYSFTAYSIYFNAILIPVKNMNLEIRPGFIFGGEYYGGFEIGFFLRYFILDSDFYLVGGFNRHSNSFVSSHNGGSGYTKVMLFNGIGFGFQQDKRIGFDITYYWTNDKAFAHTRYLDSYGIYRFVDKNMNSIIKLGLNLSWDII